MDLLMLVFVVLVGAIEIISILQINRRLGREHDFMVNRGTAGEQLGEWLLYSEVEGEPKNIEVLTGMIATQLFKSQKFSSMQEASVDSRIQNKYNTQVVEGLQKKMPIGWKFILKAADYLGFNIEEIMEKGELTQFVRALEKNEIGALMGTEMTSATPGKSRFGMK